MPYAASSANRMQLLSILGARPQFVKLAPLVHAFVARAGGAQSTIDHRILHTGQHYDAAMSDIFFAELKLPAADFNLGVGSGPHGQQTGRMLEGIESVLLQMKPDKVLVYGDTNSTLAGALAAAKLCIPVVHIEAGLRSFNRRMPEEINRVVTDHLADLLLAPTPRAMELLQAEGLGQRSRYTGDLMHDAVLRNRGLALERPSVAAALGIDPKRYGVVTVHRAENTDDPQRLRTLLQALNTVAEQRLPLVMPLHPRTRHLVGQLAGDWRPVDSLHLIDPLGYLDMLGLLIGARIALTDSGGLQKEAFILGCPCVTLREETEWVETVVAGANVVAGADQQRILEAVAHFLDRPAQPGWSSGPAQWYGDGHAAERIVDAVTNG